MLSARINANAVAVIFEGRRISFIPRSDNREISKFLYFGHEGTFETFVNRTSPEVEPESQIGIAVRIKDARREDSCLASK